MSSENLHFDDSVTLFKFARELQSYYPNQCTDTLGNTCHVIKGRALDLAEHVDSREITPAEAISQAQQAASEINLDCPFGISDSLECGIGLICIIGSRE